MARSRSGPILALAIIAALVAGLWLFFSRGPSETEAGSDPPVLEREDVIEESPRPSRAPTLALGLDPDPMIADVAGLSPPRIDLVIPELDVTPEEVVDPLIVPAEPRDLTLLVEKAMREVLAALCKRADECCPEAELCDLSIMAKMPMDEVAQEMVKQGGEGAGLDEQAVDECLLALRDFPCESDFDGMSRAVCSDGEDGERVCDEVPGKPSIPPACRRLVRGTTAVGEPCDEDQACGGAAVCVKVRVAEGQGACRVLADRGAPCSWSADCQGDLLCVRGTCSPPRGAGQVCEGAQPWCTMGRCRVGTCKYGLTCRDGLCQAQGREGGSCRMEEDCARGMVCDGPGTCRWAEPGEWHSEPVREADAELPICRNFRRMTQQHREAP